MLKVTAREIEQKVHEECEGFYPMSLVGVAKVVVQKALRIGIDACLEAAFVPSRGDEYTDVSNRLNCSVSGPSLAVLLRRLTELDEEDDEEGEGWVLAADILETLGWRDVGTHGFEIVSAVDQDDVGWEGRAET